MKDDEKVLIVVSPNVAVKMLEKDKSLSDMMLICMFAPEDTALVAKASDWEAMVDNGEIFERAESDVIEVWNQRKRKKRNETK